MQLMSPLPVRDQGPQSGAEDLICLSHLRWDFVFQRPQHLLTRCARDRRTFFIEEPLFDSEMLWMETRRETTGVVVGVPHLPVEMVEDEVGRGLRRMIDEFTVLHSIDRYVLWYYTPMALGYTAHLTPAAVIYDCMDELSAFAQAPVGIRVAERALLDRADLVLTGGYSLFEAKRHLHRNVHAMPSSVDVTHFARARGITSDPDDQALIPKPRVGFFGVLDERLDVPLIGAAAALRPDWHFVFVGPVVKIDPAVLPRASNVHYLGSKPYAQLPEYIAGWSVALLPFARNEATRFISPTKTPEYLAAGKPVVSTSIRDVVHPYGVTGLARIADTPEALVAAIAAAMAESPGARTAAADVLLAGMSWDSTWSTVASLIEAVLASRRADLAAPAFEAAGGLRSHA